MDFEKLIQDVIVFILRILVYIVGLWEDMDF